MPNGLKMGFRLFSKKYPIVIFLKPDSFICEKNNEEKENSGTPDSDNMKLPTVANGNKCSLYLFARCDRQKEEWYVCSQSGTGTRSCEFLEPKRFEHNFKINL